MTPYACCRVVLMMTEQFGMFKRGGVREMMTFTSRLLVQRVEPGVRIVDHEGYQCFVVKQADGLAAVAICDNEYHSRVAFTMLREQLEAFTKMHGCARVRAFV